MRILIAEDTPEWQSVHKDLLKKYFKGDVYELTIASTAKEAYNYVCQNPVYDLIITDLQMELDFEPDFAGEWLVKQIKNIPEYNKIPIIIMSATYNISFIASTLGVASLSKRSIVSMPDSYRYCLNEQLGLKK